MFSDRVTETCEARGRGRTILVSPSFFKENLMTLQKKFSNITEQIQILQMQKNIVIRDTAYAKDILWRIGYFPLMGGYKHLFRNP